MLEVNKKFAGVVTAGLLGLGILYEGSVKKGGEHIAYRDVGGVWTICYGHTGPEVGPNSRMTESECQELLRKDLVSHQEQILKCVKVPLEYRHVVALTLFALNVGGNGACGSRAIALLNQGKYDEASYAISNAPSGKPVWSYVNGQFIYGLYSRRQKEGDIFRNGVKFDIEFAKMASFDGRVYPTSGEWVYLA